MENWGDKQKAGAWWALPTTPDLASGPQVSLLLPCQEWRWARMVLWDPLLSGIGPLLLWVGVCSVFTPWILSSGPTMKASWVSNSQPAASWPWQPRCHHHSTSRSSSTAPQSLSGIHTGESTASGSTSPSWGASLAPCSHTWPWPSLDASLGLYSSYSQCSNLKLQQGSESRLGTLGHQCHTSHVATATRAICMHWALLCISVSWKPDG